MTQREVLFQVLDALERLEIPHMIVGSFASNYWGRPRTTHDADILIEMPASKAAALALSLEGSFYAPAEAIRDAIAEGDQFNVIHLDEAFKVDLWLRQDTAYDRERFARRRRVTMLGRKVWLSSAEDTILIKLLWKRDQPEQSRQLQDAIEVYETQAPSLDDAYLDRWAAALGLTDLLASVRSEAAMPPGEAVT